MSLGNKILAMAEFQTGSQGSQHRFRNFFSPGWAETLLYLLLSLIIIIGLNAGSVINKLSNNYIGSPKGLKTNFSTLSSSFSNAFSSALGGRLGQIILWAFVGSLAYMALWLARNVLNSFENDVISAHYLHPSSYSRAGYWGSSVAVKIFLAAGLFMFAAYAFIAVTAVLPAVAALAGSAAYNFHASTSPLYIAFCIIGVCENFPDSTALHHFW